MKIKKFLRISWLFAILTIVSIPLFVPLMESASPENIVETMLLGFFMIGIFIFGIVSLALLIAVRSKLTPDQKKPYFILFALSGLLFLLAILIPLDHYMGEIFDTVMKVSTLVTFILSIIYLFTCYLHLFDRIFLGLLTGIVIGLVLNRFGVELASFIVGFCLFLSFYGLLFLAISHSLKSKENRSYRRIISALSYVNCFIFLLLFFKFSSDQPAFTKSIDAIGVIIFILASIGLFISMPFSNFIEWLRSQRQIFYKVVLLPFLFFLIVFSLRYLLSDSTYRNIFFIEFSQTEKVHFGMEDYESDID